MRLPDAFRARLFVALAAGLAASCAAEGVPVEFRLVHGPSENPWDGADSLRFVLEGAAEPTEWTFPIDATSGSVAPLPPGEGLVLRVDVLMGAVTLARGRSFPFDLVEGGAPPHPDLYVGRLGRFAPPVVYVPAIAERAITVTTDGALLAGADGALRRYRAHDRRDGHQGEPTLEVVDTSAVPDAADRSFVGFGPGLLLAFGGAAGDALLYGPDGALLDTLPSDTPGLAPHAFEATAAALGGAAVLLVGGTTSLGGPESTAVSRIDAIRDGTGNGYRLELVEVLPLPTARKGARAVPVSVRGSGRSDCPCERVLVVAGTRGGSVVARATLVDPYGVDPTVELATDVARDGAALLPILPGHVMVAGGQAADGTAVASVDVLRMQVDTIELTSPAPPPLFYPRRGATGAVFAEGLGIVVGGFDATGAPIATAELIDYPGEALPTGALSSAPGEVHAALLGDGTLLVAGAGLVDVYVLPRGP